MTDPRSHAPSPLPADGLVVFLKEDCPTCKLVVPALEQLADSVAAGRLVIVTQDDPNFPADSPSLAGLIHHDADLSLSESFDIEFVPTVFALENGAATASTYGWHREQWQELTGIAELGAELPESRPGCGSLHLDLAFQEQRLEAAAEGLVSRRISLGELEDPIETCFARGFSDGLPVVPPTPARVARMLEGTRRDPTEVVAELAPDYNPCTIEKIAANAVMAGCRPEYLPVVIAAVEAAAMPDFNWHGLACTTYFSGPVVIVNGPIAKQIGMNSGMNALGQGNRANSTIGRALQLVLRNVGGARPGEIDRATLGNPGKLGFCFPEDEDGSPWESLAVERGIEQGQSAVTLFAGEGPRGLVDQLSRTPESLVQSFALGLRGVAHPKLVIGFDAILVVSPEHGRLFADAEWSKKQLREAILAALQFPGEEMIRGAGGCAEGVPENLREQTLPKFRPDGLLITYLGGTAGLFSAIIGGWVAGDVGSKPVTHRIDD